MLHENLSSQRVFRPQKKALHSLSNATPIIPESRVREAEKAIADLLSQRDFPCIAAIQSFHHDDYEVGFYGELGRGEHWQSLRSDLLAFLRHQRETGSTELSFWAVFEPGDFDEENFEKALWSELSHMTSEEDREKDWGPGRTTDPNNPEFCFSLDGTPIFVVGLHPGSSRRGRRFPFPTLIFNSFEQFESLKADGKYDAMVKLNRQRDVRYHGDVNPMALAHGEVWESIQFSGRQNSPEWKCPFRFLWRKDKP